MPCAVICIPENHQEKCAAQVQLLKKKNPGLKWAVTNKPLDAVTKANELGAAEPDKKCSLFIVHSKFFNITKDPFAATLFKTAQKGPSATFGCGKESGCDKPGKKFHWYMGPDGEWDIAATTKHITNLLDGKFSENGFHGKALRASQPAGAAPGMGQRSGEISALGGMGGMGGGMSGGMNGTLPSAMSMGAGMGMMGGMGPGGMNGSMGAQSGMSGTMGGMSGTMGTGTSGGMNGTMGGLSGGFSSGGLASTCSMGMASGGLSGGMSGGGMMSPSAGNGGIGTMAGAGVGGAGLGAGAMGGATMGMTGGGIGMTGGGMGMSGGGMGMSGGGMGMSGGGMGMSGGFGMIGGMAMSGSGLATSPNSAPQPVDVVSEAESMLSKGLPITDVVKMLAGEVNRLRGIIEGEQ
eukprot:jgi/Ulvmu1/10324/UM061_0007.1